MPSCTGPAGVRTVPVQDVVVGPGELLTAIVVPVADGPVAYAKAGMRNAMARAICGVAVALSPARRAVAIGVVGATATRAPEAEALLARDAPWGAGAPDAELLRARRRARRGRLRADPRAPRRRPRPPRAGAGMELIVDGVAHEVPDEAGGRSLLRVLRDDLGLTATKNACEQGECGSCTVADRRRDRVRLPRPRRAGRRVPDRHRRRDGLARRASCTRCRPRSSRPARCSAGSARRGCSSRRATSCAASRSRASRRSARAWPGTSAGARATRRIVQAVLEAARR